MMLGMSVSRSGYGHRLSGSRSPKTAIRRKSVGKEKVPVETNRRFVALDKASGWQFLKKDCPAEWVMHCLSAPGRTLW
jgi:hypothetical protein